MPKDRKYIILVPDGMADEPVPQLNGQTPLEAADTPNMDYLAQQGASGLVRTIPEGLSAGSDVGNLALLGYDPRKNYSGRAPLEAANLGIILAADEVAFRCNLVTIKDGIMQDYSAGHIATEEADTLIQHLQKEMQAPDLRFFTGKGYRHLLVVKTTDVPGHLAVKTDPPHDIVDQPIADHLPRGPSADRLKSLMEKSRLLLKDQPVNRKRMQTGENTADMIWLWGQGSRPHLPGFEERYHLRGSVISAVDLVNGIGRLIGLNVISVPGANGYYDTNYRGKAEYALDSLRDHDFVYVHVESPDEAGHNGDWKAKTACIERFDKEVVAPVLQYVQSRGIARVLVSPDHPTPVGKRVHTRDAVPFVMFGEGIAAENTPRYCEKTAASKGLKFRSGEDMVRQFLAIGEKNG